MSEVNLKHSNSSFSKKIKKIDETLDRLTDIYKAEKYIRLLPLTLTAKKELLNNNSKIKELRQKEKKYNDSFHLKKPYKHLVSCFNSIKNNLNPFVGRIASIEKNLGLDASSYFSLNFWFIYHNAFTFVLILLPFLYIPQIIMLSIYQPRRLIVNNKPVDRLIANGSCYDYNLGFKPIDVITGEVKMDFFKENSSGLIMLLKFILNKIRVL